MTHARIPSARTLAVGLLATLSLLLNGCTGGSSAEPAPDASTPAAASGSPDAEASESPAYPEQPEGYRVDPVVTVYGERAFNPCRLIPLPEASMIVGDVGDSPLVETFWERSLPYRGFATDIDQSATTECTLRGDSGTTLSLRIRPATKDGFGGQIYPHVAEASLPAVKKLRSWERKHPDERARALIDMLLENARDLDPLRGVPEGAWVLTDFDGVLDFVLQVVLDRQLLELELQLGDPLDERRTSPGTWVTDAGKVGQVVDLVEANAANPDLPQGPLSTTTGVSENDSGIPLVEPCEVFTAEVFRQQFGVVQNAPTGHRSAETEVFLSDRPVQAECSRSFEAGNNTRLRPGELQRFGPGGGLEVTVTIATYQSEGAAAKAFRKSRGPASNLVPTRGDEAYINYSRAFGVTVSWMRIGAHVVDVRYFGTRAEEGLDFALVDLPEPPAAETVSFFNRLARRLGPLVKDG